MFEKLPENQLIRSDIKNPDDLRSQNSSASILVITQTLPVFISLTALLVECYNRRMLLRALIQQDANPSSHRVRCPRAD
jgi:hypothetical protein